MVLHGIVRLTVDLDLMLSLKENNLRKFINIMKELGYRPNLPLDEKQLMDGGKRQDWVNNKNMKVFSFINLKNPLGLIDIMIDEPIEFEKIKKQSIYVKSGNTIIPIASVKDLIELKRISAREQDIFDIEALKEIESENE